MGRAGDDHGPGRVRTRAGGAGAARAAAATARRPPAPTSAARTAATSSEATRFRKEDGMRRRVTGGGVTLQAISGTDGVFLAWDLEAAVRPGASGFAISRRDHTEGEEYWITGFKTFRSMIPIPRATVQYSSHEFPSSRSTGVTTPRSRAASTRTEWSRATGRRPGLEDHAGVEASVDVTTEDPAQGVHGIYFNRGVAASQAYTVRFGAPPDQLTPDKRAEAMQWLSRGLHEAIIAFIGRASSGSQALRAAVYEFTEPGVLAAFQQAHLGRRGRQDRVPRGRRLDGGPNRKADRRRRARPVHPHRADEREDRAQQVHRPVRPRRRRHADARRRCGRARRTSASAGSSGTRTWGTRFATRASPPRSSATGPS